MPESWSSNERGYSLIEIATVIAIIGVMLALASIYGKPWVDKYNVEGQIRQMNADLLQARQKAMERNKQYFVKVNTGSYQVIEDTNENGALDASPTDTYLPAVTLKYSIVAATTGTVTIDQRGLIISGDTYTTIQFTTGAALKADYDCITMYPTRINIGSMNGTTCKPK